MKAATIAAYLLNKRGMISIHAAREGGDYCAAPVCYQYGISIHAAREGGDLYRIYKSDIRVISIHAAREGGDSDVL